MPPAADEDHDQDEDDVTATLRPPATGSEVQRAALREVGSGPAPDQAELLAVLRLAAAVTGAEHAAVNLLDDDQQVTLLGLRTEPRRVPRVESLCARTSARPGVFWAADLGADPDYADNPFVDGRIARLRFYASAPMRTADGDVIGTICAWDEGVRVLAPGQVDRLADLAEVALALVDRHRAARDAVALARAADEARAFDRALFDALPVGVIASDASGTPTRANRVVTRWAGPRWDGERLADAPLLEDLYLADGVTPLDPAQAPLVRAVAGEPVRDVELVAGPPGGPRRVTLATGEPIRDVDGSVLGAVVTVRDITEQRALEQRLRDAALHDPLTGLPNRALVLDRLDQALRAQRRERRPAVVVYCDLDGFKAINDAAGHAAGDAALLHTARALRSAVRPEDTVGRIGGDEFVVVCSGIGTAGDAADLVARMETALAAGEHGVRASCGTALSRPTDTAESLLRRADEAMYAVKRSRRRSR
ncbi:diguanylate cyclase domain-containing protein [Trujillonella humicola]|uniref:diguanylate cyclase domain-containing protein n=1 Tax=Trujillonella humicola TaxID=3383699 RepID=UPI003906703A